MEDRGKETSVGRVAQYQHEQSGLIAMSWQDKGVIDCTIVVPFGCSRSGKNPTNFLTNLRDEQNEDAAPSIKYLNVSRTSKGNKVHENLPLIAWRYTHGTGAKKNGGGMGGVDTFGAHIKQATPKKRNFSWKRCARCSCAIHGLDFHSLGATS